MGCTKCRPVVIRKETPMEVHTACGVTGTGTEADPIRVAGPETFSWFVPRGDTITFDSAAACAGIEEPMPDRIEITNPSDCRAMILRVDGGGYLRGDLPQEETGGEAWTYGLVHWLMVNGDPGSIADGTIIQHLIIGHQYNGPGVTNLCDIHQLAEYPLAPITLPPGGSVTLGTRFTGTMGPTGTCQVGFVSYTPPMLSILGHLV